jgi:hypothetical protein
MPHKSNLTASNRPSKGDAKAAFTDRAKHEWRSGYLSSRYICASNSSVLQEIGNEIMSKGRFPSLRSTSLGSQAISLHFCLLRSTESGPLRTPPTTTHTPGAGQRQCQSSGGNCESCQRMPHKGRATISFLYKCSPQCLTQTTFARCRRRKEV